MHEISIRRPFNDGLSMHEYKFIIEPYTFRLTYNSYFVYHRDEDGLFSFNDPKFLSNPLSYEEWCEKMGYDYDEDSIGTSSIYWDWYDYKDYLNPVCHKTKYGKPLMSGIHANIKNMPECPKDVADEALELARKKLVVKYE